MAKKAKSSVRKSKKLIKKGSSDSCACWEEIVRKTDHVNTFIGIFNDEGYQNVDLRVIYRVKYVGGIIKQEYEGNLQLVANNQSWRSMVKDVCYICVGDLLKKDGDSYGKIYVGGSGTAGAVIQYQFLGVFR